MLVRFPVPHDIAKRSEFIGYFLQLLEYDDVDIPDARNGNETFKRDVMMALGTFAGQAEQIMRRLMMFGDQATAVLERVAAESLLPHAR